MGMHGIAIAIKVEKGTEHQLPRTQLCISLKAVYSVRDLFCVWGQGFDPWPAALQLGGLPPCLCDFSRISVWCFLSQFWYISIRWNKHSTILATRCFHSCWPEQWTSEIVFYLFMNFILLGKLWFFSNELCIFICRSFLASATTTNVGRLVWQYWFHGGNAS